MGSATDPLHAAPATEGERRGPPASGDVSISLRGDGDGGSVGETEEDTGKPIDGTSCSGAISVAGGVAQSGASMSEAELSSRLSAAAIIAADEEGSEVIGDEEESIGLEEVSAAEAVPVFPAEPTEEQDGTGETDAAISRDQNLQENEPKSQSKQKTSPALSALMIMRRDREPSIDYTLEGSVEDELGSTSHLHLSDRSPVDGGDGNTGKGGMVHSTSNHSFASSSSAMGVLDRSGHGSASTTTRSRRSAHPFLERPRSSSWASFDDYGGYSSAGGYSSSGERKDKKGKKEKKQRREKERKERVVGNYHAHYGNQSGQQSTSAALGPTSPSQYGYQDSTAPSSSTARREGGSDDAAGLPSIEASATAPSIKAGNVGTAQGGQPMPPMHGGGGYAGHDGYYPQQSYPPYYLQQQYVPAKTHPASHQTRYPHEQAHYEGRGHPYSSDSRNNYYASQHRIGASPSRSRHSRQTRRHHHPNYDGDESDDSNDSDSERQTRSPVRSRGQGRMMHTIDKYDARYMDRNHDMGPHGEYYRHDPQAQAQLYQNPPPPFVYDDKLPPPHYSQRSEWSEQNLRQPHGGEYQHRHHPMHGEFSGSQYGYGQGEYNGHPRAGGGGSTWDESKQEVDAAPYRGKDGHPPVPNDFPMQGHGGRRRHTRVSFSTIEIRSYERVLGDNPSCSNGPAMSIGWNYEQDPVTLSLDEFEYYRTGDRLEGPELVLGRGEREDILQEMGYSRADIAEAVRANVKVKNQRRQTVHNLSVMRFEELAEKAKRKMKRALFRKSKQGGMNPSNPTICSPAIATHAPRKSSLVIRSETGKPSHPASEKKMTFSLPPNYKIST